MSNGECAQLSSGSVVAPCGPSDTVKELLVDYSFMMNGESSPAYEDLYDIRERLDSIRLHLKEYPTCPEVVQIEADVVVERTLCEIDETLRFLGI